MDEKGQIPLYVIVIIIVLLGIIIFLFINNSKGKVELESFCDITADQIQKPIRCTNPTHCPNSGICINFECEDGSSQYPMSPYNSQSDCEKFGGDWELRVKS